MVVSSLLTVVFVKVMNKHHNSANDSHKGDERPNTVVSLFAVTVLF